MLMLGNAVEMDRALQLLGSLPAETLVYPGHEYTRTNLRFAQTIEPDNEALQVSYFSIEV